MPRAASMPPGAPAAVSVAPPGDPPSIDTAAAVERLARLEILDELLPALTGVLDIREVFTRVFDITRKVIPHDGLGLPLLTDDRQHVVPFAVAGPLAQAPIPERVPIPAALRPMMDTAWDFRILDDLQATREFAGTPPHQRGYRSCLLIPIRLHGELIGCLNFCSFTLARFVPADALLGRRVADHIALALSHQRLAEAAARAAEARERAARLERRVQSLSAELASLAGSHRVTGTSEPWLAVLRQATQVAPTDTTVLVTGESGTGKEVVARYIHRASPRRDGPFTAVNCAALPDQLLESELFGYERGAFTGATQTKAGQIELASGGTLFLDEIGEMSPTAQAKLLRVLETHEVQRLGGSRVTRADIRVVAATNRDLKGAVERGAFREDLFYRLHVFGIALPALRDRPGDVLPLSEMFLEDLGRSLGRPPAGISREARDALVAHPWPGNVRELRNALERAAILCEGGLITTELLNLPSTLPRAAGAGAPDADRVSTDTTGVTDLWTIERALVKKALEDARYNKARAARTLGLTRTQLYVRLRRFGLT